MLCFDNDAAGQRATERAIAVIEKVSDPMYRNDGFTYRWQDCFDVKDVGSLVRKNKRDLQALHDSVNNACFRNPHESWLFDDLRADLDKKIRECTNFLKPPSNTLDIEKARQYPIGVLTGSQQGLVVSEHRVKYCCPLHNEKSPSFVWYKNNNSYYCFGCGKGGDVINLYMLMTGSTFVETVKKLS